jgi:nicotinate-nucleotide pyrophosphorylase (carboxylating)
MQDEIILLALKEDLGEKGDITSRSIFPKNHNSWAVFVSRQEAVFCGIKVLKVIFKKYKIKAKYLVKDGDKIKTGQALVEISGNTIAILETERVALNFIQHLSGIATLTSQMAALASPTKLLDTRKTKPNLRALERYAVKCGGGVNHRFGLYDQVMIKDNHIAACGDIASAIEKILPLKAKKIVEVDSLEQLEIALQYRIDRVLLDNMLPSEIKKAVSIRNKTHPKIMLEISGSISLTNIKDYSRLGAEYISSGSITHSAPNIDIGLDFFAKG